MSKLDNILYNTASDIQMNIFPRGPIGTFKFEQWRVQTAAILRSQWAHCCHQLLKCKSVTLVHLEEKSLLPKQNMISHQGVEKWLGGWAGSDCRVPQGDLQRGMKCSGIFLWMVFFFFLTIGTDVLACSDVDYCLLKNSNNFFLGRK